MHSITEFNIFRKGEIGQLTVFIKDPHNNQLIDVYAPSKFDLVDIGNDSILLTETFPVGGGTYVQRKGVGVYQVDINTTTYPGEYLAAVSCVLPGEVIGYNTFFKSVSARHFKYASVLRAYVDKAQKSMVDYIENIDREQETPLKLFYGYADSHLIYYLERGLQIINATPPYTGLTIDQFPFDQNGAILIDAAVIAALEAQGIFAIDTDFDYSLGGNSMVIDHFSKLSSMVESVLNRFKSTIIPFKNQYLTKGTVLYQFLPGGVRDMRMLSALPSGFWSRMLSGSWG